MDIIWSWISDNAIALLALVLTPLLAYLFNRQTAQAAAAKLDAESTGVLVTSSGVLVTNWQAYANKMKQEYQEVMSTNKTLIQQNDTLIQQNYEVKDQNEKLDEKFTTLEKRLGEYTAGIEKIFTLMLGELELTNPELAKSVRDKFSELSKIVK